MQQVNKKLLGLLAAVVVPMSALNSDVEESITSTSTPRAPSTSRDSTWLNKIKNTKLLCTVSFRETFTLFSQTLGIKGDVTFQGSSQDSIKQTIMSIFKSYRGNLGLAYSFGRAGVIDTDVANSISREDKIIDRMTSANAAHAFYIGGNISQLAILNNITAVVCHTFTKTVNTDNVGVILSAYYSNSIHVKTFLTKAMQVAGIRYNALLAFLHYVAVQIERNEKGYTGTVLAKINPYITILGNIEKNESLKYKGGVLFSYSLVNLYVNTQATFAFSFNTPSLNTNSFTSCANKITSKFAK